MMRRTSTNKTKQKSRVAVNTTQDSSKTCYTKELKVNIYQMFPNTVMNTITNFIVIFNISIPSLIKLTNHPVRSLAKKRRLVSAV